ncbi:MAG TPA: HD domain-containing phosphohydrolase [Spirochaetia bacterium]|nr:HD domain-containing phosphohydrolase [Spirochaetia bacterium]
MNELNVRTLTPGTSFNQPVFLDDRYILLSPETPVTQPLVERLIQWDFHSIRTTGVALDSPLVEPGGLKDEGQIATLDQDLKEQNLLKQTEADFVDLLDFTEKTFTNFVTKNELPQQAITGKIKDLIEAIKQRRRYFLRLTELRGGEKNYIVVHSVKTTILSLAMGLTLKLPQHRLIDLGTASLLHEIGMIRLPPQIYLSDRKLEPQEKKAITAHPVLGFKILRSSSFPMGVCNAVLESHETVNGSGYPRGLTSEKISLYAKIMLVSGAYSALISARPYRAAQDPHLSILDLLKLRGTQYDEIVLRSLVINLSIYPIGSFVQLANGTRGMVVDSNDHNPRTPQVKVIMSAAGEKYSEFPVVQTDDREHQVSRTLTESEVRRIREAAETGHTESR